MPLLATLAAARVTRNSGGTRPEPHAPPARPLGRHCHGYFARGRSIALPVCSGNAHAHTQPEPETP